MIQRGVQPVAHSCGRGKPVAPVTNSCGANSFDVALASLFKGKGLFIVHAADNPGMNGVETVASRSIMTAAEVKIVKATIRSRPEAREGFTRLR